MNFVLRITFLFLVLIGSLCSYASDIEYGVKIGAFYYDLNTFFKEAYVTSNPSGYAGEIDIPSAVWYNGDEFTVTTINGHAFQDCTELTTVRIPSSVSSIEGGAFGNSGITELLVPLPEDEYDGLELGIGVFSYCNNLTCFIGCSTHAEKMAMKMRVTRPSAYSPFPISGLF